MALQPSQLASFNNMKNILLILILAASSLFAGVAVNDQGEAIIDGGAAQMLADAAVNYPDKKPVIEAAVEAKVNGLASKSALGDGLKARAIVQKATAASLTVKSSVEDTVKALETSDEAQKSPGQKITEAQTGK